MKKIAFFLVLVIVLSMMLTSCSMLSDYTMNNIYDFFGGGKNYSKDINNQLNSNGYGYTVSGFYGSDKDVRIRSTFKNMPVTAIADNTFKNNTNITTVTIPGSVTSIGYSAFSDYTSLTTINYRGTEEEWNEINKVEDWDLKTGNYTVIFNYTGE